MESSQHERGLVNKQQIKDILTQLTDSWENYSLFADNAEGHDTYLAYQDNYNMSTAKLRKLYTSTT
jgi:hypothetical protein